MTSRTERRPRRTTATFTTRGSSVLAAALAAGIGSFALGETDLLRVAIVIIVVCLLTWLLARLLPTRLDAGFATQAPEVPIGSTIQVWVKTRVRRVMLPSNVVCHLASSPGLGSTAHLAVPADRVSAGISLAFDTTVSSRGQHTLGPLEVTLRDPLGLVNTHHRWQGTVEVLGLPRCHPVHPDWLRSVGVRPTTDEGRTADDGFGGDPDVGVREHRPEDGMRRVHWRSTARVGRLMTRLDEPAAAPATVIAFESRVSRHDAQTFEDTLELVASLADAILRSGARVRIIDSTGELLPGGTADAAHLMRTLARAEPIDDTDTPAGAPALPRDRRGLIQITTYDDQAAHEPAARTIVIDPRRARALAGERPDDRPAVSTLHRGTRVADLLGEAPKIEAAR